MNNVNFYSLGGVEEVTGSCHILEINGKKFMLDCGAFQGSKETEAKNKIRKYPEVESVIVGHAHYDHIGMIPKLIKEGYEGKVHTTPATRDLGSIVLLDSAKIQQHEKEGSIYEEKDVLSAMNHFRCSVYGKEKKISDNLKYTFYNSGHILGSALIDLSMPKYFGISKFFHSKENNRMHILYAVDLGRFSNPICCPPETNVPAPEYIVLESTYGNRLHESMDNVYNELAYIINRTIERNGKVIIPSFAISRSQELIYFIKILMREKKIPRVPVYVDSPMASNATGVFNIHSECFNDKLKEEFISKGKNPFSVKSLKFVSSYKESLKLAKSKKPCIIISCNGMIESGRIINHVKNTISDPNNTILFVGYQTKGTLGRKILEKAEKVVIDQKEYNVKAEIHKINSFSAHADYKEMEEWLGRIDTSKLKKIYLVHGESEAQDFLKDYLSRKGYNVEIIQKDKIYHLK